MNQFVGMSRSCNVEEASRGLKDPKLIIMSVSDKEVFKEKVSQLEDMFPGVPSIGCVGESYCGTDVMEKGIMIVGLTGDVTVVTDIITNVSTAPVACIKSIEKNVAKINSGRDNTVLIDFCSANDESVLTTIQSVIENKNIQLTGGTAWEGLVCCNGKVHEDACTYALVKNNGGKVKVYKENIYTATEKKHICTKAVPSQYKICELDGKPVEKVYTDELGIGAAALDTQTFKNPLGRCMGNEIYIVSLKERVGNGELTCYRKVNPKDVVCILEAGDHNAILNDTLEQIKGDFSRISGVFSVNCVFRYLYFQENNFMNTYLEKMSSLGTHAGLIGMGEHYNKQHTNQTMSCVVFE